MMTRDEIVGALRHLVTKVNRVEATIAHNLHVRTDGSEIAKAACDDALDAIDAALEAQMQTNRMLARIATELRNGR